MALPTRAQDVVVWGDPLGAYSEDASSIAMTASSLETGVVRVATDVNGDGVTDLYTTDELGLDASLFVSIVAD